jgi:hypothetical protein
VLIHRFQGRVSLADEVALVTVCLLLFLTGIGCRLKAMTLVGGVLLIGYLIVVAVSVQLPEQIAVAVYLTFAGAAIFTVGLLLSICRDRLLALPGQIHRREGIFRVLGWR